MTKLSLPVAARDHSRGPAWAPLTLVEYGDYQCPYCGAAHPVVQKLLKRLEHELRFVFRNFPLTNVHPHAQHAAWAAEAAGTLGDFWEMHDWIFEHQDTLDDEGLIEAAGMMGLNPDEFWREVDSEGVRTRVQEDFRSGIRSGVNGTPTFFINGIRYERPASFEELLQALEGELRSS